MIENFVSKYKQMEKPGPSYMAIKRKIKAKKCDLNHWMALKERIKKSGNLCANDPDVLLVQKVIQEILHYIARLESFLGKPAECREWEAFHHLRREMDAVVAERIARFNHKKY